MKISVFSWGHVDGQEYKPADEIVDGLIDRVSRGGGLLLSLCPKADGSLTPEQEKALLEMGAWLKTNDEAIFGTRPWRIQAEGDTKKSIQMAERALSLKQEAMATEMAKHFKYYGQLGFTLELPTTSSRAG